MNAIDADDTLAIVMTALPDEAQARALAQAIVAAGLGACVQRHAARSSYVWQGAMHDEAEWVLSIKTARSRFDALAAFIRARHPYELPEIVMLPLLRVSADYQRWVLDAVRSGTAGKRKYS
ncbi:MAG: divalent-cation tolerance protein CutA [Tibeticola sp.]